MSKARIELYWLPLGAGGHSVRWNGRVFEAVAARVAHRPVRDLYHSALVVTVDGSAHAIEMGPVWQPGTAGRGVVAEGPVGVRWLGRSAMFRYEVRCTHGGTIPDVAEAVASPQALSADSGTARRVLALVPQVPTPTWGRDPGGAGDMWNSNSLVSWLLVSAGLDLDLVLLPERGRAPGWDAGAVLATRRAAAGTGMF